jgi:peptidoglycan/xylan/chitin deacetylase (PgdA/CDA1 family)/SAM-dependent methyltransferase
VGRVRFGSLRRLTPINRNFGWDRGVPIDRYYIENFLARHTGDIRGRVLEIQDSSYTRRFGGDRVSTSDVLDVAENNRQATIHADLTRADHVPSDAFDCIILTQTLHVIYDVHSVARTLYRILKPGGVLLVTLPGISQAAQTESSSQQYWGFTILSAQRLFEESFPAENVVVENHGNALVATAFLQGLGVGELRQEELEFRDPDYEFVIAIKAVKPKAQHSLLPSPDHIPVRTENFSLPRSYMIDRSAGSQTNQQALILLYHQVAELGSDPWALTVKPRHFAEHLEVLRQHANPIRLEELTQALLGGNLLHRSVVVTFDDGYADNLYNAKPLLERYNIPATIFLTAGYIGQEDEGWWNELDRMFLQPGTLPGTLHLPVNRRIYRWDLGEATYYSPYFYQGHHSWRAWEDAPGPRQALYRSLYDLLYPMAEDERRAVLDELLAWAGAKPVARTAHRFLSLEEAITLSRGGLIEVGAHTVTHPALSALPIASQRDEIRQSKDRLEEVMGRPVTSFAYPYGTQDDYAAETVALVREAGFACACSAVEDTVGSSTDRFQLPRVFVQDWDGEEFAKQLLRWFND